MCCRPKTTSAHTASLYDRKLCCVDFMIKRVEQNLREFIYGGMDGAVTTFAIVTGAAGAGFDTNIILILGLANVFADGFSMAVGAYLSEKADQQLEAKNNDTKHEADETPLVASVATFISFVLVGFIPLLIYIADFIFDLGLGEDALIYSIFLTLTAFAGIGYLRAVLTKINKSRSMLETLGLGIAAAIISYTLGTVLEGIIT